MNLAASTLKAWREEPQRFVREVFGVTPDGWQEEVLARFPSCPRMALKAAKGPGKELDKETIIPTPTGDRRFGDLRVGDMVFAEDGSPTRITEVHDNGRKPVWRVTFDDGASVLAGSEHLWKVKGVRERRKKLDWAVMSTAAILRVGVRVKNGRWAGRQFELPRHGPAQYAEAKLPVDPYVFGVWLGDGCKSGCRYTGIDHEVEREIIARGYIIGAESANGQTRCIRGLRIGLRTLSMVGLGSHERFVPSIYRHASIRQRTDLVTALMDTDGCIGRDGHMEFASTSRHLADDMVWLVRSLGGLAYIKQTVKKAWYYSPEHQRIVGRDCYRVTIRTPFNPFKVVRKAERWKPADNKSKTRYLTRYIDRIDAAGEADCMCIAVDHQSRCYLVSDFIVTHNTAILAWLAWNFLLTRPHPKVACTSITRDNLRDNLWAEMAKWQKRSPLLDAMFEWQKERIACREHPETWWASARSWSKSASPQEQAGTLAGLHADYILFLLDESGGIPDAVMVAADAALATGTEAHIVQAGNPTHLEGPLYRACTSEKGMWYVVDITGDPDDPKRSSRISIQWAREQIEKYGKDNPWVLVNVFGRFPPASINTLIGPDEMADAMKRSYRDSDISFSPRILGADVARYGDDSSVIFPRQGLVAFTPLQYRDLDSFAGAGAIARKWEDWHADACFIDDSGGYGAGWIDCLRQLGRAPIGIQFAGSPFDRRYFNKRAEMYFTCVKWIKDGGQLPNIPELTQSLTQTTYTFKGDRMLLEDKAQLKERIGMSPDHADGLVLTFAQPVGMRKQADIGRSQHRAEYDPFKEMA